jgi:hypothetical protein
MICIRCSKAIAHTDGKCLTQDMLGFDHGDGLAHLLPAVLHDGDQPCPDCAVMSGQTHHWGCDMERCPSCSGQLIGCMCGPERRT